MEVQRRTFAEAFDLLLKVQAPKSKNTYAQACCVVAHLKPWFAENAPYLDQFETDFEEVWAAYRSYCAEKVTRKGRPRKLGHDRRYLVMALKRAQAKGWISKSFTKKDFSLNEVHEEIGRALSDDEVTRLLKALEIHPRTRLQAQIALTMGMRFSEILKLRVDEVDLEKRVLNLDASRLKTRRPRKVPIPISNSVLDELARTVREARGKFVFPMDRNPDEAQSDNRHWWTMARRASGVQCRFHDLRHTWATNMIALGKPLDHISKVGGFTLQVLTKIYSHMRDDALDQFRGALDGRFENEGDRERRADVPGGGAVPGDRSHSLRDRILHLVKTVLEEVRQWA